MESRFAGGGDGGSGSPGWELRELVDGDLGVLDEPIDGFAWTIVTKAVLDVVELNGGVG